MEGNIVSADVEEDSWGTVDDVAAASDDQIVSLKVKQGTVARKADGSRVETISANHVTANLPEPLSTSR